MKGSRKNPVIKTDFKPKTQVVDFNPVNLKKQRVPQRKIDLSSDIISWEVEGSPIRNNFPQQLLQNVYNSPVGSAALDLWNEFVEGDGFVNKELGDIKINQGKEDNKLKDLHAKLSMDMAYLWGCAVHVSYNLNYQKSALKHVPFESARLGLIDKEGNVTNIKYNPYFGIPQDQYTAETKSFYPYNPDPVHVKEEMENHARLLKDGKVRFEYPGQVYWFSIEKPLARVYPQPFYYSSINWFKIDSKIQLFHERNIDNNFLLSVLINMFGDPDLPAGPEVTNSESTRNNQVETVGEVFNKQLQAQLTGAKVGGSAMVNWIKDVQQKADIQPFPSNTHHDLFIALQEITTNQICIGTKTPPILLSIKTAGQLGQTEEVVNSVRVMQSRTRRMRTALSNIYSELMTNFAGATPGSDYTIKNLNPFNILPQWAIASLTPEEKRKYITENFPIDLDLNVNQSGAPVSDQTSDVIRNMTGKQLQGIQRIVRKFNKDEMTYEQAAQLLKGGFGFTDENVADWLTTSEEAAQV